MHGRIILLLRFSPPARSVAVGAFECVSPVCVGGAGVCSLARSLARSLGRRRQRYAGRHDLLFRSLHKKYEVEPDLPEEEYQASLYVAAAAAVLVSILLLGVFTLGVFCGGGRFAVGSSIRNNTWASHDNTMV